MQACRASSIFVIGLALSFGGCRTTTHRGANVSSTRDTKSPADSLDKNGNTNTNADSTSLAQTMATPRQTPPKPVTEVDALPPVTFTSSDQITKLTCIKTSGTDLDAYDSSFMFNGTKSGNILGLDVSTTTSSSHYDVTSSGVSGGYMTFKNTGNTPAMTLRIATSTRNAHGLYRGDSQTGDVTINLSCDVNGQFRVNTSDRIKSYQANN